MVREASNINRSTEFTSESEVTKQSGHPRGKWAQVLFSELVDNSLDHCEENGIMPKISISYDGQMLRVTDNGLGISPKTVKQILDFNKRTSSRIAYASPTRGAQGNATKVLLGIPYVLDGERGELEIDSQGVRHRITTKMDCIAGEPVIEHIKLDGKVQKGHIGTSVSVKLPSHHYATEKSEIVLLAYKYALLNPHIDITFSDLDDICHWRPSRNKIGKWVAKDDPPHWYTVEQLSHLIVLSIQADRSAGRSRTVGSFLRSVFAGMKRSETIRKVLDKSQMHRVALHSLASSEAGVDRVAISRLLTAMQENSTPPTPDKLGAINRTHLRQLLGEDFVYKKITGFTKQNLPFVVEAAFAESDDNECLTLISGINYSVDVGSPSLVNSNYTARGSRTEDTDWIEYLKENYGGILPTLASCKVSPETKATVVIHIATPRPEFTNRGKTEFCACENLVQAVTDSLRFVTDKYKKQRTAEERNANKAEMAIRRAEQSSEMSLKEAIRKVLKESIDIVSANNTCDFDARSHYYVIRQLIQQYTSRSLTQKTLDKVIDEWECENETIQRRTRDSRGFLLEPHTGRRIPLGTKEVKGYTIPWHLYKTVIFVEKKGLAPNFEFGQIAERFDAAIVFSEGFAVRAAQQLLQTAATGHAMKIIVIHDADISGYGIARALGNNSGAHQFNFEIIDAGLKIEEAMAMGLQTENFERSKALPTNIEWTDTELEMFTGKETYRETDTGKRRKVWIGQRIELNALAADPKAFVKWVVGKLDAHGAKSKLVPEPEIVTQHALDCFKSQRSELIFESVSDALGVEALCSKIESLLQLPVFTNAHPQLCDWAKKLKPESWSSFVSKLAQMQLDKESAEIQKLVTSLTTSNNEQ